MSRVQPKCRLVATVCFVEGSQPCLTLLEPDDGALVAIASKNHLLEPTRNAVLEAVRSRLNPSRDLASLGITFLTLTWKPSCLVPIPKSGYIPMRVGVVYQPVRSAHVQTVHALSSGKYKTCDIDILTHHNRQRRPI